MGRLERGWHKEWPMDGERLANGQRRVGEGLAKGWRRVGKFPRTLQLFRSPRLFPEYPTSIPRRIFCEYSAQKFALVLFFLASEIISREGKGREHIKSNRISCEYSPNILRIFRPKSLRWCSSFWLQRSSSPRRGRGEHSEIFSRSLNNLTFSEQESRARLLQIQNRKRGEYCFESTDSEKRTH